MAEIFDAFIIEERFKPVWTMLDEIFKKVMSNVASKKQIAYRLQQDICPILLKKLEKAKDYVNGGNWQADSGMYSINHGSDGFIVDIHAKFQNIPLNPYMCHKN